MVKVRTLAGVLPVSSNRFSISRENRQILLKILQNQFLKLEDLFMLIRMSGSQPEDMWFDPLHGH